MLEQPQEVPSFLRSPILKSVLVGILILLLLAPLAMVGGLIHERQETREEAEREVSGKWGSSQTLAGPVLLVPYVVRTTDEKGRTHVTTSHATLLPRKLEIEGDLAPEIRYRGIYEVPLYAAALDFRGEFALDELEPLGIPPGDVRWADATLSVGVPDPRGIRETVRLAWNGSELDFEPGAGTGSVFQSGIHARVGEHLGAGPALAQPFRFELALNGSSHLSFVPVGQDTQVKLSSVWPDPSFTGAFLPNSRSVTPDGFTADWKLYYLGRSYPQQWKRGDVDSGMLLTSAAGVDLILPVDEYQKSMRSAKYGILFLVLTFGAYFLFEVLGRLRIHPFQYLLVGFALVLFYVLLLSLSEHVGFAAAYAAASLATIALIVAYSGFVLASASKVSGMAALLVGLYVYLYVLLQLGDYALLLGAVGLFAALATVMWITRRVDWYALHE
jgi:inner membrane protein